MQKIDLEKIREVINNVSKYSNKKPFLADENRLVNIITEYNRGASATSLGKKYDVKSSIISTWLRRCGVTVRTRENKLLHKYDTSYFDEINTEKKAYFLGFIVADGCNHKGLSFLVERQDEYILQELLKDMSSTIKIQRNRGQNGNKDTSRIKLQSKIISEVLSKWGVVPKKAHKTYFPPIPEDFYPHFIRGVFDGDGSITIDKKSKQKRFRIAGHSLLIERIQEILINKCQLNKTALETMKKREHPTTVLHYVGNNQIKKIFEYLYNNATVYLTRKHEKFNKDVNLWVKELTV
jgi:transposase